jgi:alpha-mannosidase
VQQTKFATIRETVTLFDDIKKIDFKVDLIGFSGERYREYRIAFPLNQTNSNIAYEVPMGVVEIGKDEIKGAAGFSYGTQNYSRECSKVHPREVQDWINSSKDNTSVTISSSVAAFDWIDPTDTVSNAAVIQPILLASRKSCHWQGNYYLQPGNHSYCFSFTSAQGDWHEVTNLGKQQNQPLQPIVTNVTEPRTGLPSSFSFASVKADNILISAIKKAEDGNNIVMRLVDLRGNTTRANINWFGKVDEVDSTNIIEEDGKVLSRGQNKINMTIAPYSIETIRIK